jgi:hypothetical protein
VEILNLGMQIVNPGIRTIDASYSILNLYLTPFKIGPSAGARIILDVGPPLDAPAGRR